MIIHSVSKESVSELTHKLRERAEYLFITDLKTAYYQGLGTTWEDFIVHMNEN